MSDVRWVDRGHEGVAARPCELERTVVRAVVGEGDHFALVESPVGTGVGDRGTGRAWAAQCRRVGVEVTEPCGQDLVRVVAVTRPVRVDPTHLVALDEEGILQTDHPPTLRGGCAVVRRHVATVRLGAVAVALAGGALEAGGDAADEVPAMRRGVRAHDLGQGPNGDAVQVGGLHQRHTRNHAQAVHVLAAHPTVLAQQRVHVLGDVHTVVVPSGQAEPRLDRCVGRARPSERSPEECVVELPIGVRDAGAKRVGRVANHTETE